MKFYLDININSDLDVHQNKAMSLVFQYVHQSIVSLGIGKIAVSFPKVAATTLGNLIRLHGCENDLNIFLDTKFLMNIKNYGFISPVTEIPKKVDFKKISRIRSNMSQSKLRRLIKRGSISQNEISIYMDKMLKNSLINPYLDLYSESTKRIFRMFFQFSNVLTEAQLGEFDSYGLSDDATVPWF